MGNQERFSAVRGFRGERGSGRASIGFSSGTDMLLGASAGLADSPCAAGLYGGYGGGVFDTGVHGGSWQGSGVAVVLTGGTSSGEPEGNGAEATRFPFPLPGATLGEQKAKVNRLF